MSLNAFKCLKVSSNVFECLQIVFFFCYLSKTQSKIFVSAFKAKFPCLNSRPPFGSNQTQQLRLAFMRNSLLLPRASSHPLSFSLSLSSVVETDVPSVCLGCPLMYASLICVIYPCPRDGVRVRAFNHCNPLSVTHLERGDLFSAFRDGCGYNFRRKAYLKGDV